VEAVARRRVSHVVAFKLDRLFRDAADCLTVTGEWDRRGVALHLVDLGGATVDTSTAMGRFFLTVLAGAAEMERTLIRERTRAALAHKRDRGERVSGEAPFGFRFVDGRCVEDPAEQRILDLVARLRGDGLSLRKIAAELTRRGLRTRKGTAYSGQGVQGLVAAADKRGGVK
jgi:DNA invertase Pin-like site-specific DNA recombinase